MNIGVKSNQKKLIFFHKQKIYYPIDCKVFIYFLTNLSIMVDLKTPVECYSVNQNTLEE